MLTPLHLIPTNPDLVSEKRLHNIVETLKRNKPSEKNIRMSCTEVKLTLCCGPLDCDLWNRFRVKHRFISKSLSIRGCANDFHTETGKQADERANECSSLRSGEGKVHRLPDLVSIIHYTAALHTNAEPWTSLSLENATVCTLLEPLRCASCKRKRSSSSAV